MQLLSLSVWPNGEYSIGIYAHRRLKASYLKRRVKSAGKLFKYCVERRREQMSKIREIAEQYRCTGSSEKQTSPLGLSVLPNSRKRRGDRGLTSHGARLVRNAAYDLEKRHGRRNISFLTLTLPDLSEDDRLKTLHKWSDICKDMMEILKRKLQSVGLPGEIVYVTEYQEKRQDSERSAVPFPHLHIIFNGRRDRKAPWGLSPTDCREAWERAIATVGVEADSWNATENLRSVRMPIAGYLAKYLTKGRGAYSGREDSQPNHIRSWYGCSLQVRRRVKSGIIRGDGATAEFVLRHAETLKEEGLVYYHRYIYIPMYDAVEKCVGAMGVMSQKLRSLICRDKKVIS